MANSVPQWADVGWSDGLPDIRAGGECDRYEFKEAFPHQAHRLGKEIAAFATAGKGGAIFIGVNEAGDLVGLPNDSADARDDLIERAHGIVRTVNPVPEINIDFAIEQDKTVLVLYVSDEQDAPVYYYDYRPYVRDGRRSRPAEPEEVQEHVWGHPSSEHKRNLERLQFESLERHSRQMADQSQKSSEQMHALRQRLIDRS